MAEEALSLWCKTRARTVIEAIFGVVVRARGDERDVLLPSDGLFGRDRRRARRWARRAGVFLSYSVRSNDPVRKKNLAQAAAALLFLDVGRRRPATTAHQTSEI